jgi:hypothetical protein
MIRAQCHDRYSSMFSHWALFKKGHLALLWRCFCDTSKGQGDPLVFFGQNWLLDTNVEPQKVALTHNSVKNHECDVTYVLKKLRRCSKSVIHKAWSFPLLCRRHELCISAAYRISSYGSSLNVTRGSSVLFHSWMREWFGCIKMTENFKIQFFLKGFADFGSPIRAWRRAVLKWPRYNPWYLPRQFCVLGGRGSRVLFCVLHAFHALSAEWCCRALKNHENSPTCSLNCLVIHYTIVT